MKELIIGFILFFISSLLVIYLLVLINSNKKDVSPKSPSTKERTSKSNATTVSKSSKEIEKEIYDGAGKTLIKYFNICKAIVASDDSLEYVDFEILCFLYYVSKFTAHYKNNFANINLDKYLTEINNFTISKLSNIKTPFPTLVSKTDCLIKRIEFYDKIVTNRQVRGDWLSSDLPEDMHPLFLCSIALGDILVNPDCGMNYESSPVIIRDFFKARETEVKLMLLCDAINEYSCAILKYAT